VHDEASAAAWLHDQLRFGLGRGELPLLAAAFEAWAAHDMARIEALNSWMQQTRESSELRLQSEQMGRSLHDWLRQRAGADARVNTLGRLAPAPTWPLAYALAAWRSGAPREAALLAFGFGWAENMVQAAIKAVPLGQSAGQRMLARLAEALPAIAEAAARLGDDERQVAAPMLAILSAQHETQYSRLFRS
jgi:urease accessory protein